MRYIALIASDLILFWMLIVLEGISLLPVALIIYNESWLTITIGKDND